MSTFSIKSTRPAYPFGLVAPDSVPIQVWESYRHQVEKEKEGEQKPVAVVNRWSLPGAAERVTQFGAESGSTLETIY
ncbi:MAG: hypothetical protein M3Q45_08095 [Chloroflexota bacterium]|nr:hypothetical protein [Chloroflexota bacterium]